MPLSDGCRWADQWWGVAWIDSGIKIWDKATGNIVYDNQIGTADSADPTTVIAAGNIVIHK